MNISHVTAFEVSFQKLLGSALSNCVSSANVESLCKVVYELQIMLQIFTAEEHTRYFHTE